MLLCFLSVVFHTFISICSPQSSFPQSRKLDFQKLFSSPKMAFSLHFCQLNSQTYQYPPSELLMNKRWEFYKVIKMQSWTKTLFCCCWLVFQCWAQNPGLHMCWQVFYWWAVSPGPRAMHTEIPLAYSSTVGQWQCGLPHLLALEIISFVPLLKDSFVLTKTTAQHGRTQAPRNQRSHTTVGILPRFVYCRVNDYLIYCFFSVAPSWRITGLNHYFSQTFFFFFDSLPFLFSQVAPQIWIMWEWGLLPMVSSMSCHATRKLRFHGFSVKWESWQGWS